ncbi:MAG TPA: hypothetical protein PK317_00260 [Coprothermobacter proteolyticus]|nr:hypothetical protein [Coprothermobacter proteolyticus]
MAKDKVTFKAELAYKLKHQFGSDISLSNILDALWEQHEELDELRTLVPILKNKLDLEQVTLSAQERKLAREELASELEALVDHIKGIPAEEVDIPGIQRVVEILKK